MESDTFIEIAKQHLWELGREAEKHRLANSGRAPAPLRYRLPILHRLLQNCAGLLAWFAKQRVSQRRHQPAARAVDTMVLPDGVHTPDEEISRVEI